VEDHLRVGINIMGSDVPVGGADGILELVSLADQKRF